MIKKRPPQLQKKKNLIFGVLSFYLLLYNNTHNGPTSFFMF